MQLSSQQRNLCASSQTLQRSYTLCIQETHCLTGQAPCPPDSSTPAASKLLLIEVLGPHDAVDGLRGGVANGASWEGFLGGLRLALVAFGETL